MTADASRTHQRKSTQKGTTMTTLTTRKVFAAAACSLALLGVAACGSET